MKNLKILSLVTLFISAIISSCSPDSTNEITAEATDSTLLARKGQNLLWDPDLVATVHNNGLEYIYNDFENIPNTSQNDTNSFLASKAREFVLEQGLDSKYSENVPAITDFDISNFENSIASNYSSSFSYEYFYLKNLMIDDKKSLSDKILSLSNYTPTRTFNDDLEYTMIITMAKVGKASLEYWKDKGGEWQNSLNNSQAKFNWGAIGISDAGGAVTAAAGLWASGTGSAMIAAAGPGGAVGVGLVIAGGAIGSSATAFFAQAVTGGWW